MNTLEAIKARRSIREYTSKPVPPEVLKELLTAAMYAPSAGNAQPWHFVVLTQREALNRAAEVHPHAQMAKEAPLAIIVCVDLDLEKYPGNWVADCSAATQNLLLAATEKGLGSVWCGIYPNEPRVEAFRKAYNLPPSVVPLSLNVIGYPAEQKPAPERFRQDRIHENRW
ncbi:MAG: nitroreductase family protein [Planctomycetota bacterium]